MPPQKPKASAPPDPSTIDLPPGYKLRKRNTEEASRARRLDKDLVARIELVAQFNGKSFAKYIEDIVEPHVAADEKRLAAKLLGRAA